MPENRDYPEILFDLAEEFVSRQRDGERPQLAEYIERLPEYETEICELFPAMGLIENAANSGCQGPRNSDNGSIDLLNQAELSENESLGDFRIIRLIGRGGMGAVYLAEQVSLGRQVALKVFPRLVGERTAGGGAASQNGERDKVFWQRFQQEAQTAARLHHTNIVPVYSVGQHEGICFYAMQLIEGNGLDQFNADSAASRASGSSGSSEHSNNISSRGLTPADIAILGMQAADALAYAHRQGVIHRDIKPSNFLLDENNALWLTDFGLAKLNQESNITRTGDILGTVRYMPPEAFKGTADHRGDIYGLGLTLFELATRESAFTQSSRPRLIENIANGAPVRIPSGSGIPIDLATIIGKAVERDPVNRYQSAEELRNDLQRFLAGDPIKARPISRLELSRRWAKRNPVVASMAMALFGSLVLGLALSSWKWRDAEFHRFEAETANTELVKANQKVASEKELSDRNLYFSDIANAYQLYKLNEPLRAQRKLDAAKANPTFGDPPAWEWKFLDQLLHSHLLKLDTEIPKAEWITKIEFSPDAKLIAVGSRVPPYNSVVAHTKAGMRVFDYETGKIIHDLTGQMYSVQDIAFSSDASMMACAHYDQLTAGKGQPKGALIWQLRDGGILDGSLSEPVEAPFDAYVDEIVFSSDHRFLVGFTKTEIIAWDAKTGELAHRHNSVGRPRVLNAGTQPEHVEYNTSIEGKLVTVTWDFQQGKEVERVEHSVSSGLIASNKKFAIRKHRHRHVQVLDYQTGAVQTQFRAHEGLLSVYRISPDGSRVATGGTDNTVRVWDPRTAELTHEFRGHSNRINALEFSPDGRRLVSGDWIGKTLVWDLTRTADQQDLGAVWPFITYDRELTRDGTAILLAYMPADYRTSIRSYRFDMETGKYLEYLAFPDLNVRRPLPPHKVLDFANQGKWLVGVNKSNENTIDVYDNSTGELLFKLEDHPTRIAQICGCIETNRIVSTSGTLSRNEEDRGEIIVWDTKKQEPEFRIVGDDLRAIEINLDRTGTLMFLHCHGSTQLVDDESQIENDSSGQSAKKSPRYEVWNLDRRERIATWNKPDDVTGLNRVFSAFDRTGKKLVVFDWQDMRIKVFDLATQQTILDVPGTDRFYGVEFSSDGSRIVAATRADTTILDASNGYEILTLRGIPKLNDPIFLPRPLFDSNDDRVIAIQHNGYIRVWGKTQRQSTDSKTKGE